jgi:general L-amino acid transport system substrate-binding protein
MIARRYFLAVATAVILVACPFGVSAQTSQGSTLAEVLKRGYVSCGVSEAQGFAQPPGEKGEWRGFDVDFCRAVASAIFDDPKKVRFLGLGAKERVPALQSGWVELLASAATWTQSRDGQRVIYAGVSFYDGQSFLVRRQRSFASAQDLANVSVCVQQGTAYELELADFFHARKTPFEPKLFPTLEEAAAGYDKSECDALTADASTLYAARAKLATPAEHDILPDFFTKAPRGPVVRQGDDQWLAIVRWTLFAMIDAEEQRVSKANADAALKSEETRIRYLLGVEGDRGAGLGLPGDWPYRIVKHVGNYADVFERNLGPASPFGMERRLNALWNKGGLMYAPAVR